MPDEKFQQQNQELKNQIAILTQQLEWLKRQFFGRKSEQLNHPDLFAAEPSEKPDSSGDAATPEDQAQSTASANPKSDKRTRNIRKDRIPENLPVRTEEIIPEIVQANPQAYLQDVIERLLVTRPCDLDALLPVHWAAANRAAHPAIKSERPQAA